MARSKIVKEGGYQPTSAAGRFPPSLIREGDEEEVPSAPFAEHIDEKLVLALSHELRANIMTVLSEREASPNELAKMLSEDLSQVSYHVKVLKDYDVIEATRVEPRRGAVEHFYRARPLKQLLRRITMPASEQPRPAENPVDA